MSQIIIIIIIFFSITVDIIIAVHAIANNRVVAMTRLSVLTLDIRISHGALCTILFGLVLSSHLLAAFYAMCFDISRLWSTRVDSCRLIPSMFRYMSLTRVLLRERWVKVCAELAHESLKYLQVMQLLSDQEWVHHETVGIRRRQSKVTTPRLEVVRARLRSACAGA